MSCRTADRIPGPRTRNSLDIARDDFNARVTGPAPLSVDGRTIPGLPDRAVPLDEVRDHLAVPGHQLARDAGWAHLVDRAHTDGPVWLVGCVGVALPHLTRIAAKLAARFPGDPTDIHDAVLSGFLASLAAIRPDQPKIPTRLWWAALRAGDAALREARRTPIPTDSEYLSRPPVRPWGHEDLVLARAVAEEVLTRTEADLIGTTRLEETTVAAWADRHGVGRWAAYKIRRRAETRLRPYLLDGTLDAEARDPVAAEAITTIALRETRTAVPWRGATAVSAPPAPSLLVTNRRRAEPVESQKKSCRSVSKNGPKSGEQRCGTTAPAARPPAVATPPTVCSPEVRACA